MTIFTVVVLAILLLDLYYYFPFVLPPAVSGHTLKTGESYAQAFSEPNGSSYVIFGITVFDGIPPYVFIATWPDNYTQQNTLGTFSRLYQKDQSLPSTVLVTIVDSDHEESDVTVTFA